MARPIDVRVSGPLAGYAPGFCDELAVRHYAPLSAVNLIRLMAHLSGWLQAKKLDAGDLSGAVVERYLRYRRHARYTCWRSHRGLAPLIGYLRTIRIAPEEVSDEPK